MSPERRVFLLLCHASVYLYVCERNKQKNDGEDAGLDENRKLMKSEKKAEGGQEERQNAF